MADKNNTKSQKGGSMLTGNESRPDKPVNEKSGVGGSHNSGVTSKDPKEKEQIEKQATMGKNQPPAHNENQGQNKQGQNKQQQSQGEGLTKEELPDSTNESTGKMGSGQRQDSN
jgi:hypothetical protein